MSRARHARRIARGAFALTLACALAFALGLATPSGGASAQRAIRPIAAETGRVVVGYRAEAVGAARAAARGAGAAVRQVSGDAGFVVVEPRPGESPDALSRRLSREPGVRFAEPERVVHASFTPNDPRYPVQSNFAAVGASSAWDVERGTSSVVIAVVDSGVDLEHPDLAGRLDTKRDYDFVARDTVADDRFGHGTHVAGIIAANTNNRRDVAGLAHRCTLLPVRVLDSRGMGTDTAVAEGIRHAVRNGADVINLSLGMSSPTRVVEDAIEYAIRSDVVVVAAAGNKGTGWLDYPAAYPGVIAVGATDSAGERWAYSQFGEGLDLVAPGVSVLSLRPVTGPVADGPVGRLTGTSVAVPHVSGVAGLLRSAYPTMTAAGVADRLALTAHDLGAEGLDELFGHGMVRADRALLEGRFTSDDDFPGAPLCASPVRGTADATLDVRDVFAVTLRDDQRLRVRLTGPPAARFSLVLLGADAESLADATPLASVVSTGGAATIDHTVEPGDAGAHRVIVSADEGAGPYVLTWKRGYDTRVTIKAPQTPEWDSAVSVRGRVLSAGDEPVVGVRVRLDAYPAGGGAWRLSVAKATTDSDGVYRFRVRPTRKTTYRVRFLGSSGEFASTSDSAVVWPRAALSAPRPTTIVRRDTRFTVAGTLRPTHPAGDRSVRITVWRKDSSAGGWVHYRTTRAFNRDGDGSTRYIRRFTLPRGVWKFVASVDGDRRHAPTSATSYLSIR